MTLRRQLMMLFAVVGGVGALCACLVTVSAREMERVLTEVLDDNVAATDAVRDTQVALLEAVTEAQGYLLTGTPAHRDEVASALARATEHVDGYRAVIDRARAPEQHAMAATMRETEAGLRSTLAEITQAADAVIAAPPFLLSSDVLTTRLDLLRDAHARADPWLQAAVRREAEELQEHSAAARAHALRSRRIVTAAGGFLFVVSVLAPLGIQRWLMPRIDRLIHSAETIATGDLTHRTGLRSSDEIGMLAAAIDDMATSLQVAFEKEHELAKLRSHFVSMASHEFRTPLTTILASAQSLVRYENRMTPAQRSTRLTNIASQVGVMTQLLDDVLLYGRGGSGTLTCVPEPVDLPALCERLVDEVQSNVSTAQRVLLQVRSGVSHVRLDPKLLRQILGNILTNALKYSPEQEQVLFAVDGTSSETTFRIVDFGIGIPDADQKMLFQPFHRASNVGDVPGTGLGLAITKQAIDLHGGTVSVTSTDGGGTTVIVTIPHPEGAPT